MASSQEEQKKFVTAFENTRMQSILSSDTQIQNDKTETTSFSENEGRILYSLVYSRFIIFNIYRSWKYNRDTAFFHFRTTTY